MLAHGDELYGIGTIERIYAGGWPEMTTICLGTGHLYDWLRECGAKVELVEGLSRFRPARNSVQALGAIPGRYAEAKRDAERIHAVVKDRGIRIIHTHWLPQQLIAGHLRRHGYHSVWQINNNMNPRRLLGLGRRLNHQFARWGADLLLPASDFIGQNWDGSGVPMTTVRNAAISISDTLSPMPPIPPIRCLVAGRLVADKGHHLAVDAVLRARREGHDIHLDIFGGPLESPYADALRGKIAAENATQAIQFKGFCDDLRERHVRYHLGLQLRIDPEPCSLWVCETMVDGLPLIATATGGTPELVADGVSGVLIPADDSDALARVLIELAEDPTRLAEMRQAAFTRGQQQFRSERFLAQTLEAYHTHLP